MRILEADTKKDIVKEINKIVLSTKVASAISFFLSIIALMAALGVGSFIAMTILTPLEKLKRATDEIGKGHFNIFMDIKTNDEIGALANAFQQMAHDMGAQRRALEQSNAYTENILASITDIILLVSPKGIISRINRFEGLGYNKEELIGIPLRRLLVDKEEVLFTDEGLDDLLHNQSIVNAEVEFLTKGGVLIPVLVSCSVMCDIRGVVLGLVLAARDMRERDEIMSQLRHARQKAEEANRVKSAFLATMSHEIRTPMNAILGLNDLALQNDLHPKVRDYLRKMRSASKSLLRIINDILDFSKIEAGKLDMEQIPFHLVEIFENLANLFRNKIADKKIEWVLDLPSDLLFECIGDPLRLEQVLINLIGNSLKFTQQGYVMVQAHCLEQTDQAVKIQFSVRDSGIGLSSTEQEKLFQAFSQADSSTTRHYGGTGLGLAISKQLVELMGGQIWVESQPEQGSHFHFTVSFGVGQKVARRPLVMDDDLQGVKVLLVDDNREQLRVIEQELKEFSFSVTAVNSGTEALAVWRLAHGTKEPFSLLLIDYGLSDNNGLEIASEIRKQDTVKIVLMTTFNDDACQQGVAELALDGLLEKPVSRLLLFDTLRELFGKEVVPYDRNQNRSAMEQQVREKIPGARLLLVDDIALNRQVARELLERVGFQIDVAVDGRQAVLKVEQDGPFDALLMDLQMPEMDGYEATRAIRQNPAHAQLPIIAMTAHTLEGIEEQCRVAGMNAHIAKPIHMVKLCKTLLHWIPEKRGIEIERAKGSLPVVRQQSAVAEEPIVSIPTNLPGMDVAAALEQLDNDIPFFKSILSMFLRDFMDSTESIRAALDDPQEEGRGLARRLSHSVKGVAGNLCADSLLQAAKNLEQGILENREEEWPLLLETFDSALVQVLQSAQTLLVKS